MSTNRNASKPSTESAKPLRPVRSWVGRSREWTEGFFENLADYPDVKCVVLLGSAIRQRVHNRSDLDLLIVLGSKKTNRFSLGAPVEVDIRLYLADELDDRLAENDEILLWALKYGVLAYDKEGIWGRLADLVGDSVPLPSANCAHERSRKSMRRAGEMLAVGDEEAASDLILAALTQLARKHLINAGVFPASRPELPSQLRALDRGDALAELLESAMFDESDPRYLVEATKGLQ